MQTTLIRMETKKINEKVIKLINESLNNHQTASEAIRKNDVNLSIKVLENDRIIDAIYLDIEADLEFLVTKGPVDKDLRRVLAYLSIIKELERIADYAKHIAKFVIKNNNDGISNSSIKRICSIHDMFFVMLNNLQEAIKEESMEMVLEIAKSDKKIDEKTLEIRREIIQSLTKRKEINEIDQRLFVLNVVNSLERACDHIVNICEMIVYINNGKHTQLD